MVVKKEFEVTVNNKYTGSIKSIDFGFEPAGSEPAVYTVLFDEDQYEEELYRDEVEEILTDKLPCAKSLLSGAREGVRPVFTYLDDRLSGNCDRQYDCTSTLEVFKVVQMFDPSWFKSHHEDMDCVQWVKDLGAAVPTLADLVSQLILQLPAYKAACNDCAVIGTGDITQFTEKVLSFFAGLNDDNDVSAWTAAALRVFSMSPNSASCERVFSLLKLMFSSTQLTALSDYVQGSLMLRYNGRDPG